jgi:hypothetical protein
VKVRATLPEHKRDLRLDLFRGLANWLIFFGHIPHTLLAWLTIRNYGFSDGADMFVFISGYTATLVYARMMLDRGFIIGATRIWKRVGQIYIAQLLLFLFYTATIHHVATGFDLPGLMDDFNVAHLLNNPGEVLTGALTLRFKPVNLDVLPLYIALMAAFPFVLWVMLYGPDAVMLASVALYAATRYFEWNLTSYPDGVWYFDPFAWQLLFMLGAWLVLGGGNRIGRIANSRWVVVLSVAFLVFAAAITLSQWIPLLNAVLPEWLRAAFLPNDKTYLAPYRVAHLAALIVLVTRYMPTDWKGLNWPIFAPLIKCGQQSLEVFCTGVYLAFVAHFILITVSDAILMQIAVGAAGISIMVTVAYYKGWSKDVDRPVPRGAWAPAVPKGVLVPAWRAFSERRRHRKEVADRLKQQRQRTDHLTTRPGSARNLDAG